MNTPPVILLSLIGFLCTLSAPDGRLAQRLKPAVRSSGPGTSEVVHQVQPRSFRLTVRYDSFPNSREVLLWKSPDRWRDLVELRRPDDPIVAGYDGAEAWRCISGEGKHLCDRWDAKVLTEVAGKARVDEYMWIRNGSALACPVNPWSAYWKDKFGSQQFRRELRFVGEERVESTLTLKYESTPHAIFQYWFGKEDGIVRRMVMLDRFGKEFNRKTTTKLELDVDIKDSDFALKAPAGAMIQDRTAEAKQILRELSK